MTRTQICHANRAAHEYSAMQTLKYKQALKTKGSNTRQHPRRNKAERVSYAKRGGVEQVETADEDKLKPTFKGGPDRHIKEGWEGGQVTSP